MTPDERNMLTDLANKIAQTPAPPKDPDAEELIRTRIGNRPDALYLMTQTVLIQNMALQQAQKQIQDLQQNRGSVTSSSGSFLGQGASAPSFQQQQPQYAQQPQSQPQYAQPAMSGAPGGAPSFLRGAAQTAAGVAAGALAFEGIQSLFSHPGYGGGAGLGGFGGGGFGGGGFGGGLGDRPMDETVVNNYYDTPGGGGSGNDLSLGDNRDQNNFADTGDAGYDNTASDFDSSDGGGFDDSGSDFS